MREKYRKFGGKLYEYMDYSESKKLVVEAAKEYRQEGYLVRVVKETQDYEPCYFLYVRRKYQ